MKNHRVSILAFIVTISLIFTLYAQSSEKISNKQNEIFSVSNSQKLNINSEIINQSIILFKSLSREQQTTITQRMIQMSQERQKAIEAIEKQIAQVRFQSSKNKINKTQDTNVSQLENIQKTDLKENAT